MDEEVDEGGEGNGRRAKKLKRKRRRSNKRKEWELGETREIGEE